MNNTTVIPGDEMSRPDLQHGYRYLGQVSDTKTHNTERIMCKPRSEQMLFVRILHRLIVSVSQKVQKYSFSFLSCNYFI